MAANRSALPGRLAARSQMASVGDQGKLMIPNDLGELAGLAADSTVVLVGRHSHFEIWNRENCDGVQELECRESAADAFGIL